MNARDGGDGGDLVGILTARFPMPFTVSLRNFLGLKCLMKTVACASRSSACRAEDSVPDGNLGILGMFFYPSPRKEKYFFSKPK